MCIFISPQNVFLYSSFCQVDMGHLYNKIKAVTHVITIISMDIY